MSKRFVFLAVITAMLLALFTGPAFAKRASDHDGDADSSSETSHTEDSDADGVGNCPDPLVDADNRHPSGKDRHCESEGSGTQGKSESDPDDNGKGPDRSNGGIDKADGPGGLDLLDQDGNNGCGNDDDFEDDNEGLCLGRQKEDTEVGGDEEEIDETDNTDDTEEEVVEEIPTEVLSAGATRTPEVSALGAAVLGVQFAQGAPLPMTGISLVPAALLGLMVLAVGALIESLNRRRRVATVGR